MFAGFRTEWRGQAWRLVGVLLVSGRDCPILSLWFYVWGAFAWIHGVKPNLAMRFEFELHLSVYLKTFRLEALPLNRKVRGISHYVVMISTGFFSARLLKHEKWITNDRISFAFKSGNHVLWTGEKSSSGQGVISRDMPLTGRCLLNMRAVDAIIHNYLKLCKESKATR